MKQLTLITPIFEAFVTLIIVSLLVFMALRIVPGDPIELMLGESATPVQTQALKAKLGLDQPVSRQVSTYIKSLLNADLGTSITKKRAVTGLIREYLPNTVLLALTAALIANLFGIPLGVYSAWKKNTRASSLIHFVSILVLSLPSFWIGPLLVILFSFRWPWLPISSFDSASAIILPSLTLSLGMIAVLIRTTNHSVEDCLNADYLQTARAKGNTELRTLFVHALPNAFIPVLMTSTLQLGNLLAGAVVTEAVFDWPGLGSLLFESISSRDYPVVQGVILFITLSYVLINTLTEIVRKRLSPEEAGN